MPVTAHNLIDAWRTSNRATIHIVRHLTAQLWNAPIPGAPRRTIRTLAAHLHNTRCSWVRTLGREHGIVTPVRVDHRTVTQRQLAAGLRDSGRGIEALLELGIASGGHVPPSRGYVWRNLSLEVAHVLTYFVAHEAHHRGQIALIARQAGRPLSARATSGLWRWRE